MPRSPHLTRRRRSPAAPRRLRKKAGPLIFIQPTGTYSNQVLVAVGASREDVLRFVRDRRQGLGQEARRWIEESEEPFAIFGSKTAVCAYDNGRLLLLLAAYTDTWPYWETLVHELHHAVHFIAKDKLMLEEMEAQAYLQEFLFREIRRRIQEYYGRSRQEFGDAALACDGGRPLES